MSLYQAYGLRLESVLPLPGLVTCEGSADVCIDYIDVARASIGGSPKHTTIHCVAASCQRVHLTWGAVGDLLIEEGQHITIVPGPACDMDALALFILGAGLGVLLHQRGLLVLHGSGVSIFDRGVGFIGAKGQGKSTMVAALQSRAHPMISDEHLVIRTHATSKPYIVPGIPQVRLWVDALNIIGDSSKTAVRTRHGVNKFAVNSVLVIRDELALNRLYLLDVGHKHCIQPISRSDAFLAVLPHLYVARFGTHFLQSTGAAGPFHQLNEILKLVEVKRLFRRPGLDGLNDIANLIEAESASQQCS